MAPSSSRSDRSRSSTLTKLRRLPARGAHDRATIDAILDEALLCHMGYVVDGQPYVIPTLCARIDDRLYVHGSAASRTLRSLAGGLRVCVTVTLIDGLVLARSAFEHSVNYRSVIVFGTAELVEDSTEPGGPYLRITPLTYRSWGVS